MASKFNKLSDEIASLSFSGKHMEARNLYQQNVSKLDRASLLRSNFHLGLSYTRTSEYSQAEQIFIQNYRLWAETKPLGEEGFYVFQGLSFYRFFFSKHKKSLEYAHRALASLQAKNEENPLPYALVNDILAHNYFQMGSPAKGGKFLKQAIHWAKRGDLSHFESEFQSSEIIYQSEYSLSINESIQKLKKALATTPETNDYTKSEIVLQLAKLLYLTGSYKASNEFLQRNFEIIFKNENKRKVAKLNTLLCMLMQEKGHYIEALSLLKVAKNNLDKTVDVNLLIPCLGLEVEILSKLGKDNTNELATLKQALALTDKSIPQNIQARRFGLSTEPNVEDNLGRLMDRVRKKELESLDIAIDKNLLHIAKSFFPSSIKEKSIYFHPANKGILICTSDIIKFIPVKLSKTQLTLIQQLVRSPKTKEQIIQVVWGYSYDPLRHDHLVYSNIRRLRKILEPFSGFIISNEELYSIDKSVEIFLNQKTEDNSKLPPREQPLENEMLEGLNFRQIKTLDGVFTEPFSAGEHATMFEINRMTSFRDLSQLVERGLLIKRGKGKGTKYLPR